MCKNCNCDPCWPCGIRPLSVELTEASSPCCPTFFADTYVDGNDNFPNKVSFPFPASIGVFTEASSHKPFGEQDRSRAPEWLLTVCESVWSHLHSDELCRDESGVEFVGNYPASWTMQSQAKGHVSMALGPHVPKVFPKFAPNGADPDGVDNTFDGQNYFPDFTEGLTPQKEFIPTVYAGDDQAKRLAVKLVYEFWGQSNYVLPLGPNAGAGSCTLYEYRVEYYTAELPDNCREATGQIDLTFRSYLTNAPATRFVGGSNSTMNDFLRDLDYGQGSCLQSTTALMNVKVNLPA